METDIQTLNEQARRLDDLLRLETYPLAVKWYEDARDVPAGAMFPMRDKGKHIALCQAFSLARMRGMTVAMEIRDHWCWNPLVAFGMVDCSPGSKAFEVIKPLIGVPPKDADDFLARFPRLEAGKYKAVVVAPLYKADFMPDVILIYSNTAQLNMMLRAVKSQTGELVKSVFDGIDSCAYATVPTMLTREFRITIPDPGDVERARAGKDEIIFSVPPEKLHLILDGLERLSEHGMTYRTAPVVLPFDFERPPFYNELFKIWGLDQGEDW